MDFWNPVAAAQKLINTGNIGNALGDLLGFDATPGYNLQRDGSATYSGTANNSASQSSPTRVTRSDTGSDTGAYTTGSSAYYGGGSGGNADVVNRFDQSIALINDALDRLPNQLAIAQGNINRNYNTQSNELDSGKAAAQQQYSTSTNQNAQNYRTNKNAIADQASGALRGLMRLLGAYGAVGSDLGVAGNAVTNEANIQRAGAGQTYSQNQQGLDTNWNTYQNDWTNEKRKLNDWRTEQLDSAQAQNLTTKQDLLTRLADFKGQRAAAQGGSYAGSAQEYLDQAQALGSRIDALGRINPTYTGKTVTYDAPTLDSYALANAPQATIQQTQGATSPLLALLLGRDKTRQA